MLLCSRSETRVPNSPRAYRERTLDETLATRLTAYLMRYFVFQFPRIFFTVNEQACEQQKHFASKRLCACIRAAGVSVVSKELVRELEFIEENERII